MKQQEVYDYNEWVEKENIKVAKRKKYFVMFCRVLVVVAIVIIILTAKGVISTGSTGDIFIYIACGVYLSSFLYITFFANPSRNRGRHNHSHSAGYR